MQSGEYIKRIEIDSLWNGQRHIIWELMPNVNILSGVNGVGKSTILNKVVKHLLGDRKTKSADDGIKILLHPEEAKNINFDVVRSFDRPMLASDNLNLVTDAILQSELDFHLYQLQRKYLDYQVNLSNRMVELYTTNAPDAHEKAQKIALEKTNFQDIVDDLFCETGKTIVRDKNEIFFASLGEIIPPYKLSSGEKQMLIILLTVLIQNRKPYVLFMDEPEVSLHIQWQQRLISLVRCLNPQCQIILTTHSPAVIMDGWADCVTDVDDIVI